jgi:hypothetical protein
MKNFNASNSTQISRRKLLVGGVAAGSATLLAATDANATVKLPKSAVRFSKATNGHNCGSCKLFVGPADCMFVQGPTPPEGSCWIWRAKHPRVA